MCGTTALKVKGAGNERGKNIPVTVSCKANVLILGSGSPAGYTDALRDYLDALAADGPLSALFVNLRQFQILAGDKPLSLSERFLDRPGNLRENYLDAIRYLSQPEQTSARYVILLGGVNSIPMPDLGDSKCLFDGDRVDSKKKKRLCDLPSDRLYAVDSANQLTGKTIKYPRIVARIPGTSAQISQKLKQYAALHRDQKSFSFSSANSFFLKDRCGRKNDCWLNAFVTDAAAKLGKPCQEGANCFSVPSYCQASVESNPKTCNAAGIFNLFKKSGLGVIETHGSGISHSAVEKSGKGIIANFAQDLLEKLVKPDSLSAGFYDTSCYGGSIDHALGLSDFSRLASNAQAHLSLGAPFHIGTTRSNFGEIKVNQHSRDYRTLTALYGCTRRIGDCLYSSFENYETSEEINLNRLNSQSLQFYGDPTLNVKAS